MVRINFLQTFVLCYSYGIQRTCSPTPRCHFDCIIIRVTTLCCGFIIINTFVDSSQTQYILTSFHLSVAKRFIHLLVYLCHTSLLLVRVRLGL